MKSEATKLHNGMFRIVARNFVAGALVRNGYVAEAAPILRHLQGHKAEWVGEYCSIRSMGAQWYEDIVDGVGGSIVGGSPTVVGSRGDNGKHSKKAEIGLQLGLFD